MQSINSFDKNTILNDVFSRHRGGLDALLCKDILEKIKEDLGEDLTIPWVNSISKKTDRLILVFQVAQGLQNNINFEKKLNKSYELFNNRMQTSSTWLEKRGLILDLLYEINSDKKRQEIDKEALENLLDLGGVIERYRLSLQQQRRYQEKRLIIMGELIFDFISYDLNSEVDRIKIIKQILTQNNLETLINDRIDAATNWMPRVAALSVYQKICRLLPNNDCEEVFSPETISLCLRKARDPREDIWVQRESLKLIKEFYPSEIISILEERLKAPTITNPEEIFVYAEIVRLLGQRNSEQNIAILDRLVKNPFPSEYVRIEIVKAIGLFPINLALSRLFAYTDVNAIKFEPCEQVRVAAIEELGKITRKIAEEPSNYINSNNEKTTLILDIIKQLILSIKNDKSDFVRRVAMEELTFIAINDLEHKNFSTSITQLAINSIDQIIEAQNESVGFRRLAWQYRENIVVRFLPGIEIADKVFKEYIEPLFEGQQVKIPLSSLQGCSLEAFARKLANQAINDFGYFIKVRKNDFIVQKGERWGISFWRILHEIRNPAPDKRKGALHSVGRKAFGTIRIPSQILAELTKTRVPGEPLFIEIEGGWRPFIPLLTDCLTMLVPHSTPIEIFTSLGISTIKCRLSYWNRIKAWIKLSWNFEKIADLRNVGLDSRNLEGPVEYLNILSKEYGIDFHYQPYEWQPENSKPPKDPSLKAISSIVEEEKVETLSPLATMLCIMLFISNPDQLWDSFQEYFFNLIGNSNLHLWIFFLVSIAIFLGKQILVFRKIRTAIDKIPLVFGGWGTRGKSGTERKKAALFHGMGYKVFSKTTGCEAMFLHTASETRAAEIFLYRPYDKASIWEMGETAIIAEKLKAEVYLWECMALNPRFVKLLQKQWMRDDISTITNTYPDHEDIQGPAGIDLPRVMTNFLPTNKPAYTSEDQMLPILREGARKSNSPLYEVGWREPLMFTKDLLDIFPYKVHPRNLALVLKSVEHLNIERDFILKEISEHIVPDLGVLKTYPVAEVFERKLEFTNAMSANERRGFNDSWRRAGHSQHNDETSPGTYIITVVNNRADRIPRSQVFAEVVVADAFAHKHVLIGTNLNGLYGYICQSLEKRLTEITFYSTIPESNSKQRVEKARKAFDERLNELKAEAISANLLAKKTKAMFPELTDFNEETFLSELSQNNGETLPKELLTALEKLSKSEEIRTDIIKQFQEWQKRLIRIEKIYQMIDKANNLVDEENVMKEFCSFARELFISKLVVVENALSTGDQVIAKIAKSAPPGFYVRVIGMQNIKGTGLDFVYRWLALEKVVENIKYLKDKNERLRLEAIDFFTYFQEYGLITRPPIIKALKEALVSPNNQKATIQQRLEAALNIAQREEKQITSNNNKVSLFNRLLSQLETFLESSDSKDRRKEADKIMSSLVKNTISHERAATMLREITLRQKGGWLSKKFSK